MDRCKVFTTEKRLNKSTTLQHVPVKFHLLKRAILTELSKESKDGKLKIKKISAIVDYLAKLPPILAQSRTREKVVHGFVANGFLDSKLNIMPVLQQIIGSRKKVVTQEEMKLCFCSFCDLMEYSYSHGWRYIPDDYFIDLGFPVDIDLEGREKLKKWGILLECR